MAVLGVGVGAAAGFAEAGARWTFFEIDPYVVWLARDSGLFAYLPGKVPDARIVTGDGRLALADDAGTYDLIVADAFAGGYPPIHLLTAEALGVYQERLGRGGVLAVNASSRYLDLVGVVAATADRVGLTGYVRHDRGMGRAAHYATTWIVLAADPAALEPVVRREAGWERLEAGGRAPWTDRRADLVGALGLFRGGS